MGPPVSCSDQVFEISGENQLEINKSSVPSRKSKVANFCLQERYGRDVSFHPPVYTKLHVSHLVEFHSFLPAFSSCWELTNYVKASMYFPCLYQVMLQVHPGLSSDHATLSIWRQSFVILTRHVLIAHTRFIP